MGYQEIFKLASDGIFLMLLLSLPPVLVATLLGLLVSLIQALTQIQEQNLPFAIKLIGVTFIIIIMSSWTTEQLLAYTEEIYKSLARSS